MNFYDYIHVFFFIVLISDNESSSDFPSKCVTLIWPIICFCFYLDGSLPLVI